MELEQQKKLDEGRSQQHCCGQCEASFTRLEHLRRHETMHTKVKAFTCVFCFKDFARSDVLRRHYQSCKLARRADTSSMTASRRVNRACISCRQSKLKCSGHRPCERCENLGQGHLCRFLLRKPRESDRPEADTAINAAARSEVDEPPENSGINAHDDYSGVGEPEAVQGRPVDPSIHGPSLQAEAVSEGAQTLVPTGLGWMVESDDSAIEVISDQASIGAGHLQPFTAPSISLAENGLFNSTAFDLSPGMFLNLDLLDYGIIDSSLMMLDDSGPTGSVTTASVNDTGEFPDATPSDHHGGQGGNQGPMAYNLPKGIGLMQISPLEAHRTQILQYLQESPLGHRSWDRWLCAQNMTRYLNSYFSSFHRHTPLLHLPSWNISTTSTRLLFSMVLMGAMYSEDLNPQSSTDRQLCQAVQTFAWDNDPTLKSASAQLDTIQAVYIATLVEAFYFPPKRHGPTVDTKRLLAEARRSGLFSPNRALKEPWNMTWDVWSREESRKRTAFILYLFDAIQAIFFEQPPTVQLQELRLPLPCDESIYSAETEEEWSALFTRARDLTKVEYPVLLGLFLSHRPLEIADLELNLSVMGAFIVLHGIVLRIWEQQNLHKRDDPADLPDEAEKSMYEHLSVAQAQVADNALQLWLRQWNKTLSRPATTESHGLYRERSLVYWFLGNLLNQSPGSACMEGSAALINGRWKMKIPGLLRRLAILVDSGELNSKNGGLTSVVREQLASYLKDMNEGVETEETGAEGLDTVTMRYIMKKDRN